MLNALAMIVSIAIANRVFTPEEGEKPTDAPEIVEEVKAETVEEVYQFEETRKIDKEEEYETVDVGTELDATPQEPRKESAGETEPQEIEDIEEEIDFESVIDDEVVEAEAEIEVGFK